MRIADIESELLPMLRETAAPDIERRVKKQLDLWGKTPGVRCEFYDCNDSPWITRLPDYDMLEIHYDCEKMFVRQLKAALGTALSDSDGVPSVRADMGCGLVGGLFGLTQRIFPDKMPWLQERLSKQRILSLQPGEFTVTDEYRQALEHMRYMKDKLQGTGVEVFPIDLQGPIDSAHLLYGDEFFYDLYDDPDFINHLLDLVHAALVRLMTDCFDIIQPTGFVAQYNKLALPVSAPLKISEDTSTLLGREHIFEYCVPRTRALLEHFGGGYIHYCGWNPHLYEAVTRHILPLGLNLGNTERHDMAAVLRDLAERGMFYYGSCGEDVAREAELNGVRYIFWIK
ncbi:MAG: hypothetical protein FWF05_01085 [Oscillospiraceae bacterium]|nr:hypothetical protein [Oscillospiraceae bacterium]